MGADYGKGGKKMTVKQTGNSTYIKQGGCASKGKK